MRIATFNVNGIRAASRRGFDGWLAGRGCDVVGLQEVRCPAEDLPTTAFGDYLVTYFAGNLAGRNGVAILTRTPPTAVRTGFGSRTFDAEGRYLEVDLDPGKGRPALTVGSLYLPKGGAPSEGPDELKRYRRKMRFLASYGRALTRARRVAAAAGREFVVMGDFNIAHAPLDVTNWRSSRQSAGFLPEERQWFDSILGPRTLLDVVRRQHPETPGPYSWWAWREPAFVADTGWRVDYQLASPGLARAAVRAGTDKETSYAARISDHSPVVVDYDL
ncbi:MAG TPA: exodeoxyribonuclease III [Propionibacteriaceae bacterium]|nr:exodeoxyribonuclease III [Propionibacteriaceae bacterium]